MHTLSFGGLTVIQLLKAQNLNIFLPYEDSQLISEPTNFEPHKNPSCIDLITDQPNIILDSGEIWRFNRANSAAIKRRMISSLWLQHFSLNPDANWQFKTFIEIFLNITPIFIPNKIKNNSPRDPPPPLG